MYVYTESNTIMAWENAVT